MSTATVTPIPTHYESVIKDAETMDWDVVCSDTSVKLTPPRGKKSDQIVLPLTQVLAPPQLTKKLSSEGFLKAVQTWERGQKQQEAESAGEPQTQSPVQKEVKMCPECVATGVALPYASASPQGMGTHRRRVHKVVGTSPDAVRKRQAKKAAAPAKKTAAESRPAAKKAEVPAPRAAEPEEPQQAQTAAALPESVSVPLQEALTAVQAELDRVAGLEREAVRLGEFFDKVDELVHDGNQTPVKVLAAIQDLTAQAKQK